MKKARRVQRGDCIGVLATGSPSKPEAFQAGIAELERRGFRTRCPLDPSALFHQNDRTISGTLFASASTVARVDALHTLLDDSDVSCIIAVRGGYGGIEMLPEIDPRKLANSNKLFIGYSDATSLLVGLQTAGLSTVHGPMVSVEIARAASSPEAAASADALFQLISGDGPLPTYNVNMLRSGAGEGKLLCGNLTILLSLLGTPWEPDTNGTILIVEDVNEPPYRVHRALTQLKLAGKLSTLAGFGFGTFLSSEKIAEGGITFEELFSWSVKDIFVGTNYPVFSGLPVGHRAPNLPVPIGCTARVADGALRLLESPVG